MRISLRHEKKKKLHHTVSLSLSFVNFFCLLRIVRLSIFPSPLRAHAYDLMLVTPPQRFLIKICRLTSRFTSVQPNSDESLKTLKCLLYINESLKKIRKRVHTSLHR